MKKRIVITGSAGFIGAHLASKIDLNNFELLLWDRFSDYYSPTYKESRVKELLESQDKKVENVDLLNGDQVRGLMRDYEPSAVIHLAAQPGVRLNYPEYHRYLQDNIMGFQNILSACVQNNVSEFLYASSSSVYDDSNSKPFSEVNTSVKPRSFYGITKKWNEEAAKHYAERFGLRTRGLRFFTVYGPWGRPDMAYFRLIACALGQYDFRLFGNGEIERDFTFINDVTMRTLQLLEDLSKRRDGFSDVVNIGGQNPQSMLTLINTVEEISGKKLKVKYEKSNSQDLLRTESDKSYCNSILGNSTYTSLNSGIEDVFKWASKEAVRKNLNNWIDSTI